MGKKKKRNEKFKSNLGGNKVLMFYKRQNHLNNYTINNKRCFKEFSRKSPLIGLNFHPSYKS